ncbi:Structural maintenance of chromosomes protein 4 [Porphyridium purpureum]|uniref:Structural maintenance of chromosomes protein n=1 Tax=Porphyridium purpureum TaxID=35688 RepID=A0A5J4Z7G0_PORPP|nr:Structural maintenance of chromosomes protein 4 [Porphyridium purpureum]|eukprot:POR4520..scf295_1
MFKISNEVGPGLEQGPRESQRERQDDTESETKGKRTKQRCRSVQRQGKGEHRHGVVMDGGGEELHAPPSPMDTSEAHRRAPQGQPSEPHVEMPSAGSAQEIKPRLIITEIVMENFKSYGGRVTVGPFHKRFSAIVGPNGSGKSNTVDAMIFVFGRKASQMRMSKLAELIHKSDTFPNCTHASVTIRMAEIIDTPGPSGESSETSSENEYTVVRSFEISRSVDAQSASTYRIDGRKATQKDMQELLMSKGVDLKHNRFLILQGEVETISTMPPKGDHGKEGLLEYLEDIIGTVEYVERIEEAATALDTASEERSLKLNRVKAMEQEKKGLEGPKLQAEAFLEKKREMVSNESTLLRAQGAELVAHQTQLRSECELLRSRASELKLEKQTLDSDRKETDELHARILQEFKANAKKAESLKAALTRAECDAIQAQEASKFNEKQRKSQTSKLAAKQKRRANLEKDAHANKVKLTALEAELLEAQEKKRMAQDALDRESNRVKGLTGPFRAQLENRHSALGALNEQMNEAKKKHSVSENELKVERDRVERPKQELNETKAALGTIKGELDENAQAHKRVSLEHAQLNAQLSKESHRLAELRKELDACTQRAGDLEAALSLQEQRAREFKSNSRLEARLMDARIDGVIGKLSGLGTCSSKYNAAIQACMGGSLNHFVVETEQAAQACIELLKREKLGRVSFIVLDKIQHLVKQMGAPSTASHGEQRMIDKITPIDDRFRVAFYFVLRNTLLAQDLESGTRMAFRPQGTRRVVTVLGQLIESNGAMSGGGIAAKTRASSSEATDELPLLLGNNTRATMSSDKHKGLLNEHEAAAMRTSLAEVVGRRDQLESAIKECARFVEALAPEQLRAVANHKRRLEQEATEKQKSEAELKSRQRELERRLAACHTLSNSKNAAKQIDALQREVEADRENIDMIVLKIAGIESEIQTLEAQVVQAGGEVYANAKKQMGEVKRAEDELRSAFSEMTLSLELMDAELQKIREGSAKLEAEIEALHKEQESIAEKAEALAEAREAASRACVEADRRTQELQTSVDEAEKAVTLYSTRSSKLEEEVSRNVAQIAKLGKQLALIEEEFGKVKKRWLKTRASLRELLVNGSSEMEASMMTMMIMEEGHAQETPSKTDRLMDKVSDDDQDGGFSETALAAFDFEQVDRKQLTAEIELARSQLTNMTVDLDSIRRFNLKEAELRSELGELDTITAKRDCARRFVEHLRKERLDKFMAGFVRISTELKKMYQMITLGGDAELELVDTLDPFSEGILFSVRPPKKSWKNIAHLSGGEKTLSSLALVFALHSYKPNALYFMDEIDAALDFRNVSIVANYVQQRTKGAQFIIISLRNNMFELADRLVGIYKQQNTTRSVAIDPAKFVIPSAGIQDGPTLSTGESNREHASIEPMRPPTSLDIAH